MPDLTLVEKLRQIADAKRGDPMPECLGAPSTFAVVAKDPRSGASVGLGSSDWATPLSAICKDAADKLEAYEKRFGKMLSIDEAREIYPPTDLA